MSVTITAGGNDGGGSLSDSNGTDDDDGRGRQRQWCVMSLPAMVTSNKPLSTTTSTVTAAAATSNGGSDGGGDGGGGGGFEESCIYSVFTVYLQCIYYHGFLQPCVFTSCKIYELTTLQVFSTDCRSCNY